MVKFGNIKEKRTRSILKPVPREAKEGRPANMLFMLVATLSVQVVGIRVVVIIIAIGCIAGLGYLVRGRAESWMEEKDSGSLCLPDTAKPTDLFDLLWRRMKEVGLGRFPAGRDVSIEIQYDAGVCCFTTRISVGEEGKEQVIHLCHVYRGRLRVIIDKISYRRNTEGQQIQIVSHWLNRAKSIRDEERAGRLEMTAAMLGFPRPF